MGSYIGHDVGTGGVKSVLVGDDGTVRARAMATYPLHHPRAGWAEQEPEDFWRAIVTTTRALLASSEVAATDIRAIAFAGQMLALVPMDARGNPTRRAISWMDGRADVQARRIIRRFGGERILSALAGGSPTGKDLVAKIAWIEDEEPDVFARTRAFGDVTSYLVARATGRVALDPTAAGGTGLYALETRSWSGLLARVVSFPLGKLPEVVPSTSIAGELTVAAADALGLRPGLPVAMGMADIPGAAVGSGAVRPGDAHVYLGTSSWIGVTTSKPKAVPRAGIASVPNASRHGCLLIGESETAGACRDWIARALGGVDPAGLDALVSEAPPGADGLLFAPWLFGERSPVPDTRVRGAFVNLTLEHGRPHLARAVHEGVALNLRWVLDAIAGVDEPCPVLRAIGGGARSDVWLQILADVTGRPIDRVAHPQEAGAIGAALVGAIAVGALRDVSALRDVVSVERRFEPRTTHAATYADHLAALRELHPPLSRAGRLLRSAPR